MARIIWTEPALDDLKETVEYIARDSPSYAARFASRIVEAPRKLESFPRLGRVVPEFQDQDIRELIYGSYRIIYTIRGDVCYIVSVIHGSRDIQRHVRPADWDLT